MADCRCSNITIMQLFHELKQRFPTIPDHVVSKVIQQNCHDKSACETILQQESHYYVQCYPGALISGEGRPAGPIGPLSDRCSSGPGPPRRHHMQNETGVQHVYTARPAEVVDCDAHLLTLQLSDSSRGTPSDDEVPPEIAPNPSQIETSSPQVPSSQIPTRAETHSKEELSKIPLSKLVREAQVRHNERVTSSTCEPLESIDVQSEPLPSDNLRNEIPLAQKPSRPQSFNVQTGRKAERPSSLNVTPRNISSNPSRIPPNGSHRPKSAPAEAHRGHRPSNKSATPSPLRPSVSSDTPRTFRQTTSAASPGLLPPPNSPSHPSPSSTSSPYHSPLSHLKDTSPNRLVPPHSEHFCGCASRSQETPNQGSRNSSPQEYKVDVECVVRPSMPGDRPRSITSVNLTLRPPSTESPHLNEICSGQSLTYTTAKFDPRQGYQSHLQIRISSTLLEKQRERKNLLELELRREKEKLHAMRMQVKAMQTALECKPSPLVVSKLKADIDRLRSECERLTATVDRYSEQNNVPLGETDENFYDNIYTGQRPQRGGWSCRLCTFRNHPLLRLCEQCEMPRLPLGTSNTDSVPRLSNPVLSNNNPSCAAGETSASVSRTIAPLQER